MTDTEEQSAIAQFFRGKSVFITGGTGFVGKQIIEKLLRSCPDVKQIYILIRSKRGLDIASRVHQICSLELFDKLRSLTPDFEAKIIPIIGDITNPNFGLNKKDEQLLTDNCDIIINAGASVRFFDPLKESLKSNLLSVHNVITLCRKMKHLQACVHVSTAYVHSYRMDIDEIIYPTNENPNLLLRSIDFLDDEHFDHLSEKVLQLYPNTYSYTKSLAEYLILQEASDLPFAIIRPSIIGATWQEPIPGWIDSYSGSTNAIITIGKRLLRAAPTNPRIDHPLIPVDTVANMTIAIAWFTATSNARPLAPLVYNCCTGRHNEKSFTYQDLFETIVLETKSLGYDDYWILGPHITATMNKPYYHLLRFFNEIMPAYLLDLIAYVTFKKPKMVKLNKKVRSFVHVIQYYTQHQWIFSAENNQMLLRHMTHLDRKRAFTSFIGSKLCEKVFEQDQNASIRPEDFFLLYRNMDDASTISKKNWNHLANLAEYLSSFPAESRIKLSSRSSHRVENAEHGHIVGMTPWYPSSFSA